MDRDDLAAASFVLAALAVMAIGFLTGDSMGLSKELGKPMGEAIFLLGVAAFTWTASYLKGSFFGKVAPVTDRLIKQGPYHWVRHPLYLSMTIMILGLVVALRSLMGVVGTFAIFVPVAAYRARLEERALASKFGRAWIEYAADTSFLIPYLW